MAPDLRRKVDAARAARLAREAEMKKQVEAQVSCSVELLAPLFYSLCHLLPTLCTVFGSSPLQLNHSAHRGEG